jgi:hypothetical protein
MIDMDVFTRCGILKIKDEKILEPKAIIEICDSFNVSVTKYPNLFHRFFILLLLGWKVRKVNS